MLSFCRSACLSFFCLFFIFPSFGSDEIFWDDVPEVSVTDISGGYVRMDVSLVDNRELGSDLSTATSDDGYELGFGVGHQTGDIFRVDLTVSQSVDREISLTSPDVTTDVSLLRILGNFYWDIGNIAGFTPYVGLGAGSTRVSYDYSSPTYNGDSSWRFGWAAYGGISYDLTDMLLIDLGYAYHRVNGDKSGVSTSGAVLRDGNLDDHIVRLGLRYRL